MLMLHKNNWRRRMHSVSLISRNLLCLIIAWCAMSSVVWADHLHLMDGTSVEVDEAWEDAQGIWYRQGGVTYLLERTRVKTIEHQNRASQTATIKPKQITRMVNTSATNAPAAIAPEADALTKTSAATASNSSATLVQPVWIYLVGGARVEVDEANETAEGVWYKRGNLSIFIERARIERIEREQPVQKEAAAVIARKERGWSTGSRGLDNLIRQNGTRFGVDPYLIFCVMEQESHFNARALSPMGARGLMQLMPGTAARFGVRRPNDPAQNVAAGTRYLKQLLGKFDGRVDLVLASYNAGEGAVLKYGHRVPPYRETRNYVKKISVRYGRLAAATQATEKGEMIPTGAQ